MSKRILFWQTAKAINWSIIFQALNDLLLIALPTIVAVLSGNMTQMLLGYDKEGIFLQLPFFIGALVLNIALPPFIGMLSALILFRQSLTDDRRGLASFLSKSLKTAYSIDEGEIEEKISGDMLMYRYTVLFMVSQPIVIVVYAVEAFMLFKEMNSIIFGVTVLVAASFPLIRSFLKGTWRASLKKKESEYKEQKKNLEYIFYSANSFIRNNKLGDFYIKKMQGMFDEYRNTTAKQAIGFDARTDSLDFFTRHGSKIIIIIVGCVLVSFDKLAPGSLLTGLLVLPSITLCYNYLQRFISYEKGYGKMYERVRFLFEDIEEKEETQELGGNWSLEINDINFGYTEEKQVIEHKDFRIRQGEKLVISGANGSGKSTLAALLAGLYPDSISKNQITVTSDGTKKHTDIISLRKNIAYLTQDAYLFSGTIADNLSMASDNEELGSSVLSELSGNSLDLSKEVEEAGANLSPGQQQKISLARALIKKAELLILDEPGNHLDKEGLDWLGDFLVRTDKAVVLISHDETLTSRIG